MKKREIIILIFCIFGAIIPILSALSHYVLAYYSPWFYLHNEETAINVVHDANIFTETIKIWNNIFPFLIRTEIIIDIIQFILLLYCVVLIISINTGRAKILLSSSIILLIWNIYYAFAIGRIIFVLSFIIFILLIVIIYYFDWISQSIRDLLVRKEKKNN